MSPLHNKFNRANLDVYVCIEYCVFPIILVCVMKTYYVIKYFIYFIAAIFKVTNVR